MTRSAHIRVDRLAFIAALKVRLAEFKKYEKQYNEAHDKYRENVKAIETKHEAATQAWFDKITAEGLFTIKQYGQYGIDFKIDPKHEAKRPRLEPGYDKWPDSLTAISASVPSKYARCAVYELENTLGLLELSVDDTVSTYTYGNVAQYI